MKKNQENDTLLLGKKIIEYIQEKKGLGIVSINLTKTENSLCEFFIIAHADSDTQVRAIAKHIENSLKEQHQTRALHAEGYENAQWVLLDFSSILVHVFQKQIREYYKLEDLWADAEIEEITESDSEF